MGDDNGNNFDRVIDLTERSVDAWAKAFTKLEELNKQLDWIAQEDKELNNVLRAKPCVTETVPYANLENSIKQDLKDIKEEAKSIRESNKQTIATMQKRIDQQENIDFWLKILAGIITLCGTIAAVILILSKT
jgi:hypothetical protein